MAEGEGREQAEEHAGADGEAREAGTETVASAKEGIGAGQRLREFVSTDGMSKGVLIPAALAATAAAAYAAKKSAPKLKSTISSKAASTAEDTAEEALSRTEEQGGIAGFAAKLVKGHAEGNGGGGVTGALSSAASKVTGGRNKEPSEGWGKGRRNPIQLEVDVGVPLRTAYDQWTHLEEFPKFMHRVVSVQPDADDRSKVKWQEKIWFSKRDWEAQVVEQVPDRKIAWKTVTGTSHVGHVTFHQLEDDLTRVLVTVDFNPSGLLEKFASGLRFVKRAAKSDLYRYKAFIETHGEPTGAWRGRIDDGEVVEDPGLEEGKPFDAGKELRRPGGKADSKGDDRDANGNDDDDRDDNPDPRSEGGDSGESYEERERRRLEREARRRERHDEPQPRDDQAPAAA